MLNSISNQDDATGAEAGCQNGGKPGQGLKINDSNLHTLPGLLQRIPAPSKLVHSRKLCTQLKAKKQRFHAKRDKNNQQGGKMKRLHWFWFWGRRTDVGQLVEGRPERRTSLERVTLL